MQGWLVLDLSGFSLEMMVRFISFIVIKNLMEVDGFLFQTAFLVLIPLNFGEKKIHILYVDLLH